MGDSGAPLRIRDAREEDFAAILRLNEEWVRFTSPLDEASLARLHAQAARHRVAEVGGEVVAFLLALREGTDYDSPNYLWFMERGGEPFLYVDRVIVDGAAQGTGVAGALYDELFAFARKSGVARVVCELDVEPPNEASRRFRDAVGFAEVGRQWVAGGKKRVSLRELRLG